MTQSEKAKRTLLALALVWIILLLCGAVFGTILYFFATGMTFFVAYCYGLVGVLAVQGVKRTIDVANKVVEQDEMEDE